MTRGLNGNDDDGDLCVFLLLLLLLLLLVVVFVSSDRKTDRLCRLPASLYPISVQSVPRILTGCTPFRAPDSS